MLPAYGIARFCMSSPVVSCCTWQADCCLYAVWADSAPLLTGCSCGIECTMAVLLWVWMVGCVACVLHWVVCSPCAVCAFPIVFHCCDVFLLLMACLSGLVTSLLRPCCLARIKLPMLWSCCHGVGYACRAYIGALWHLSIQLSRNIDHWVFGSTCNKLS